jgi:NAD dependent epimerase/dehydratase
MTTLITGAAGFIGSHITETLLRDGHQVRALVRYNSRSDIGHLASLPNDLRESLDIRAGDIADPFFTRDAIQGCDRVLHLAALIGIPYSYVAPSSYVTTNITGTLNVLEACRQAKVRRVIVTSTSEVYGTALYSPIDEKHPLQGQSPYSASKIGADKIAESYFRSFDLPVVILRPFNTYGPRQSARAVIPAILVQAVSGSRTVELGNCNPKRDLTFVSDTVHAFLLALETPGIEGETINFGQGRAWSIEEVATTCLRIAGSDARLVFDERRKRPERSEVSLLLCDATKAQNLLGWKPDVSFEQGLEMTANYLVRQLSDYRPRAYAI